MKSLLYLKDVATLRLDPERCSGCGVCLEVCPRAVLARSGSSVSIVDRDACMECGACARNCPTGALTVNAGVGCATAVINTALGRNKASCCCYIDSDGGAGCDGQKRGPSSCC